MITPHAGYWIEKLQLIPHPEGGYFKRSYTSAESIDKAFLAKRYGGDRPFATAIYYLLGGDDFSALHRLKSDELWHFYAGSPITIHIIDEARRYRTLKLGNDFEAGQSFQAVIQAGWWFGTTIDDPASYALLGCTVSPGFESNDFELAERAYLLDLYPEHAWLIKKLTRAGNSDRPSVPG